MIAVAHTLFVSTVGVDKAVMKDSAISATGIKSFVNFATSY